MAAHIELIQPFEKLGPNYQPPAQEATIDELALALAGGQIIWKVAKSSVRWRRPANYRLLSRDGVAFKCVVVGGDRHWYFVHVLAIQGSSV